MGSIFSAALDQTAERLDLVLLRHFPELEPALGGVANLFARWRAIGG